MKPTKREYKRKKRYESKQCFHRIVKNGIMPQSKTSSGSLNTDDTSDWLLTKDSLHHLIYFCNFFVFLSSYYLLTGV